MGVQVGIIMGSQSDWPTMQEAAVVLDQLGVTYEVKIVSAHRTPDRLWEYGTSAVSRGLQVLVAGAGGAAHLPGMMASKTRVPVIGFGRCRQSVFHRADAQGVSRGHHGHWCSGGGQCGVAGGRDFGAARCGLGPKARGVAGGAFSLDPRGTAG